MYLRTNAVGEREELDMLEVQREAIVADANAASTGLIYRELQCLQYYLGTIGTQSALVGGFSVGLFNLDVFPDGNSIATAPLKACTTYLQACPRARCCGLSLRPRSFRLAPPRWASPASLSPQCARPLL